MGHNNAYLVSVIGPTAAGKTHIALDLAHYYDTVIVSADSRQFYREMEIGTDKPTPEQQDKVPHYFVDSHSIHDELSASDFAEQALETLGKLFEDYQVVILVGGSGLYLKALLDGFDPIPAVDQKIREKWNGFFENYGKALLEDRLKAIDPDAYQVVDTDNPKRVIRALEVKEGTGYSITAYWQNQNQSRDRFFTPVKLGVYLPRAKLYQKIEERCDEMLANGLLEEVKRLFHCRHMNPLNSVGYREFFRYLEGHVKYEEAVDRFKAHSRQLAKRQLTWFRRDPDIRWYKPDQTEDLKHFLEASIKMSKP